MRNEILLFLFVLLVSIPVASSQEIESYKTKIELSASGFLMNTLKAEEEISMTINNTHFVPLKEFSYPISDKIENLIVLDAHGVPLAFSTSKTGKRTYVTVYFPKPLSSGESTTIIYKFSCSSQLRKSGEMFIFSTRHSILANVKKYELKIFLPEGYVLAELGAYPGASKISSDGKRVILEWSISEPYKLPDQFRKFEVMVLFTKVGGKPAILPFFILFFFSLVLGALFHEKIKKVKDVFLSYFDIKRRIYGKIEVLKEDEQEILRIIVENDGIDQREIQRITGFSKAKVSKILSELEKRGMIRKEPVGRKNKIYLTDKVKRI